jgi:hypothetical protein
VVAVAFTVLVMPNTWHHPLAGAFEYLAYPIRRRGMLFSTAYFGRMYRDDLPWHYADVMTLITAPPLVLIALPAAALARGRLRRLLAPVGFALAFWIVLVHLPRTPRHDEVRQFVSACALLGLVAWAGIVATLERIAASRAWLSEHRTACRAAATAACLAAAAILFATVARAHPHELSYYNRMIGGVRGAEAAGMELSLYFEALNRDGLAAIERHTRPGQTIYMRPAWPGLLTTYAAHGVLRADIGLLPPNTDQRPDWLLLVRRRFITDEGYYLAVPATYEVRYDGVSLLKLVRLDDAERVTGVHP